MVRKEKYITLNPYVRNGDKNNSNRNPSVKNVKSNRARKIKLKLWKQEMKMYNWLCSHKTMITLENLSQYITASTSKYIQKITDLVYKNFILKY